MIERWMEKAPRVDFVVVVADRKASVMGSRRWPLRPAMGLDTMTRVDAASRTVFPLWFSVCWCVQNLIYKILQACFNLVCMMYRFFVGQTLFRCRPTMECTGRPQAACTTQEQHKNRSHYTLHNAQCPMLIPTPSTHLIESIEFPNIC